MKRILTLTLIFILGLFFITTSIAQQSTAYSVLLKSGNFLPEKNINTITKDDDVFSKSLFDGKYYVVIQFNKIPSSIEKNALKTAGIDIIEYLPNYCYTASVDKTFNLAMLKQLNVRAIFSLTAEQKTLPLLLINKVPDFAINVFGYADLTVLTYDRIAAYRFEIDLSKIGAIVTKEKPIFKSLIIRVPISNIQQLINLPFVQWVEPIDEPNQLENLLGRSLHRDNVLNDGFRNLKGDSINAGVWDGGEVSPHLDFSPTGRVTQLDFSSVSDHTTHVSGTILGRGLIDPKARGMSPNSKLYAYDFNGDIQSEMNVAIPQYNLAVSNHSYGGSITSCGLNNSGVTYTSRSQGTDINLNNYPYHLHVHSSGNAQSSCTNGWSTITGSGKSAKNNFLVANISTTEAISGSSSFGPVQDGRVKPEISSFGSSVFSTYIPLNTYGTISGTSMATPGITGSAALLYQRYKQLNGVLAPSTLIKNIIMNTAFDLGNPGPDYKFGFGRINALEAVRILESNRYVMNTVANGASNNLTVTVPANASKLRVMLTWNDPAGSANANPCLVNNLDLSVIKGATTSYPWILDKNNPANNATTGVDDVSNIEQVEINNPASGTYTLKVDGTLVSTGPSQLYALTWVVDMPYIEVTYPNGNESFNTGSSETITWNNSGVTSNQTIEYSINNGSTWNAVGIVSNNVTRFAWTVPSGLNTSTAKIRVSTLDLSDVSDDGFKILGTVTGFYGDNTSCNPGEVILNWNNVLNATNYDVYILNNTTGYYDLKGTNVSGTTYTASGLTPNTAYWFTIRSKNSSTLAISERAVAINVTSSVGNLPPATVVSPNSFSQCNDSPAKQINATGGTGSFTWTPQVGLYTDATGFFAYTAGDPRSTVYAKPLVTTRYFAVSTNTSNCFTQDTSRIIINCSLPVSFLNFSGRRINAVNELNWTTSTEQNNSGFEIEKSIDGNTFSKIGFVASKGDNGYSNSNLNYSFKDDKINSSLNYYRLKQVDFDNKSKWSNTILIKGERINTVKLNSVFPNPATENLSVSIDAPNSEQSTIVVTDIYGKTILTKSINIIEGSNLINIHIQHLSNGTYFLKLVSNKQTETSIQKFIKM